MYVCVYVGGGDSASLSNSRTSDRSEAGEVAMKNFQRVLFKRIKHPENDCKSSQGQVKGQIVTFRPTGYQDGLITAASLNFVKMLKWMKKVGIESLY